MDDTERSAMAINMRISPADAWNSEHFLPMNGPCQRGGGDVGRLWISAWRWLRETARAIRGRIDVRSLRLLPV